MKIILGCALFLSMVTGISGDVVTNDEIRYHERKLRAETMWVYNSNGMAVYSVKGELLNGVQKDQKCKYAEGGDCNFKATLSDSRKYVFAAQEMNDSGYVTVHDLDTEQVVGLVPTCAKPIDIKYHSARHEMWITCDTKGVDKSDGNYNIDVIGAESLTSNHQQISVDTSPEGALTGTVVDNDLGNVMYTSQNEVNAISKIDLSTKEVLATFNLFMGVNEGLFGMTYCKENKHLYAFTSNNELVEFDTVEDSLVTKTTIPNFTFNKIAVSPKGDKVLLLGDETVHVVEPKKNGRSSEINFDRLTNGAIDVVFQGTKRAVFLSRTEDEEIVVLTMKTSKTKTQKVSGDVMSFELSGDGKYLWVTTDKSKINIFKVNSKLRSVKQWKIPGSVPKVQFVSNKEREDELNELSSLIELRIQKMEGKISDTADELIKKKSKN